MATLLPYCLRLTCTVTNTGPRLASSGMADTLLDGISTRITMHPCFVAHYVINFENPAHKLDGLLLAIAVDAANRDN